MGVFEKKQKHHGTDREQLITQSFSMDDTQTSEQKKNQRKNERSRSRPKSEGATQEYSDTVTSSKPRPASVSGPAAKENKVSVYTFNNVFIHSSKWFHVLCCILHVLVATMRVILQGQLYCIQATVFIVYRILSNQGDRVEVMQSALNLYWCLWHAREGVDKLYPLSVVQVGSI